MASSHTKNAGTILRGNCRTSAARTFSVVWLAAGRWDEIRGEAAHPGGILAELHSGGLDLRQLKQSGLDLPWFNANTVDLDLIVGPAQGIRARRRPASARGRRCGKLDLGRTDWAGNVRRLAQNGRDSRALRPHRR